jgi:hypothetical protein
MDEALETLTDLLIRHRGKRLSHLAAEDQQRFRNEVAKLEKFTLRVCQFATANLELIEAVFWDMVDGLRAHLGRLGWIRSARWLLTMLSRGITPSGWLYVEARQRIKTLTDEGIGTEASAPAPPFAPELQRFAFEGPFHQGSCPLRRHKRNRALNRMVVCARGCDVQMLEQLKFHEVIIARILGLSRSTAANRAMDCKDALQKAARLKPLLQPAASKPAQVHV